MHFHTAPGFVILSYVIAVKFRHFGISFAGHSRPRCGIKKSKYLIVIENKLELAFDHPVTAQQFISAAEMSCSGLNICSALLRAHVLMSPGCKATGI